MSELYELPNGWEWTMWKGIVSIKNGKDYREVLNPNGKYPIYGSGGIINYADEYLCNENSVIIGRKGTINNPLFVKEKFWNIDTAFGLEANADYLLPMFLFYFAQQFNFLELNTATTLPSLTKTKLQEIYLPLPPLTEQQRIVEKLDLLFEKIDKAIALHQKNIDEADAFMGSALNEVFDKDQLLNWDLFQFDKISKFIDYRGKTPQKIDNGIQLITAKNVRFGYLSDEPKEYISEDSYGEWMVRGIPKKGDILFTTEAPLGNVAILNTDSKRVFAQRLITFQPLSDDIYISNFLFYYLMSPHFRDGLNEKSTGTTVKGIKASILKKFTIHVPSLPIQQKIVTYLDDLSDKIERVKTVQKEKMDSLKALKASILDKAFRGEL